MASAARVFLLLALVAMLVAGAFADRALLKSSSTDDKVKTYKSKFALKKACKAAYGKACKTCLYVDEESTDVTCDVCAGKNTGFDGEACVCEAEYGTVTKSQYKAYKKDQMAAKKNGASVCGGGGGGAAGRRGGGGDPQ